MRFGRIFGLFILTIALFIRPGVYAQSVAAIRQALYYERYQTANQLSAELILTQTEVGKALFWQSFAALETGDETLLTLNLEKARQIKTSKPDIFLLSVPAIIDMSQHRPARARKRIDSLQKRYNISDPDWLMSMAGLLVSQNQHQARFAIQLLEKIPHKKRTSPHYYQILGDAYRRQINGSEAVQAYRKAIEIKPSFAKAYTSVAKIYLTQHNMEAAVEWLQKAITADEDYGPAYFELFYIYYYEQPEKARDYMRLFVEHSDKSLSSLYLQMDFHFVQREYTEAIEVARQILSRQNLEVLPRVHKLKAYAYAAMNDSAMALTNMEIYFQAQQKNDFVAKDYLFLAKLLGAEAKVSTDSLRSLFSMSLLYSDRAADSIETIYAFLNTFQKDHLTDSVIVWSEKLAQVKQNLSAIDIYNWGIACYQQEKYTEAEKVFALYTQRYPNEIYGWLWRARSVANDPFREQETDAIPFFEKVIWIGEKDLERYRNIVIQAHGYIGALIANYYKDYSRALRHFEEIIKIDPKHSDAMQYVELLRDWINE